VRNNEILRLTPRTNEDVNSEWMCDNGRVNSFKFVTSDKRIAGPMLRKDGVLVEVGWDEAISHVVSELHTYRKHEIAGIGSAYCTNEDNYIFGRLFKEAIGSKNIGFLRHTKPGDEDDLLIRADKTPNSLGAALVGLDKDKGTDNVARIFKEISSGTIKVLYVLEDNIAADPRIAEAISNLEVLIVHSSVKNETTKRADVILSASTFAEKYGTYTNCKGRVQRVRPAVAMIEQERAPDKMEMSRWDKFAAQNDTWGKGVKRDARSSWRIVAAVASAMGVKMKYATAEDVFKEIAERIPAFKGLSFSKIGIHGADLKKEFIQSITI
jgi:NADH-quinone oxidoreductase subunit G